VLLGFVLLVTVALQELADQGVFLTADEGPVVVGQLASLRARVPGELLPLALEHVPVHADLLLHDDDPGGPHL
jgi:hypothetical protein